MRQRFSWAGVGLVTLGVMASAQGTPVRGTSGTAAVATSHSMGAHMAMTDRKPGQPGDQARADAIVKSARSAAAQYADYRKAIDDGYIIFMANLPQHVYHFVKVDGEESVFDAAKPPALLYKKTVDGYKLTGVMYMAPWNATDEELNARVPLSVTQWHAHTNLCVPPPGNGANWIQGDKKFGLDGVIATPDACRAAGGRFRAHLAGWMVHVYPFETDPERIWQPGMDEDQGAMPGMKM